MRTRVARQRPRPGAVDGSVAPGSHPLGRPVPSPESIALPAFARPRVNVVIPVHGQLAFTLRCLDSIARAAGVTPFDVTVVDDASTDGTADALARIPHLRVQRLERNVGYLRAVNAAGVPANRAYVCLLNNDVEVQTGWLDALVATMDDDPTIGLAGARLVDLGREGVLAEAGGVIFRDGTGVNYGRGDDAGGAAYLHLRDVDYCSAAAVLVRTEVWQRLGGFDERFAPAYYEDTDLAFGIRAIGYRVVYQPASIVRHAEGASHGTDLTSGVKAHQVRNRERFVEKWADELSTRYADATAVLRARDRRDGPRVVVVDAQVPTPDSDSGSLRMWSVLQSMQRAGAVVTFVPTDTRARPPWSDRLRHDGVEVLDREVHLERVLDGLDPDLVLLSRVGVATRHLLEAREHAPRALLVFDTVDLHHLRVGRRADLEADGRSRGLARSYEELELALVRTCDVTLTVSSSEQRMLLAAVPDADVRVLSNVHDPQAVGPRFADRRGVLFVGNHRHPPNNDAAVFLAREVMPLVRRELPGLPLVLAGNDPTPQVRALADACTRVEGWLPDLRAVYDEARIAIAPLRYGAGVKGKVGEAMSRGVPTVLSPIAAEGMDLVDGTHALIGEDAAALAAAVVRLHEDHDLWCRVLAEARVHVDTSLGPRRADEVVRGLLDTAAGRRTRTVA